MQSAATLSTMDELPRSSKRMIDPIWPEWVVREPNV